MIDHRIASTGHWCRRAVLAVALLVCAAATAPVAAGQPDIPDDAPAPWWRLRDGSLATSTAHFDVFIPRGADGAILEPSGPPQNAREASHSARARRAALQAEARTVAQVAEAVLPTVESRLATPLQGRVRLALLPADAAPPPCEPRAAAIPARRRIVLFVGPQTLEPDALAAFLAHEIGHQLAFDRWGATGADRRLSEGIATWAAEPYWLAWRGWPSLAAGVRELHAAGAFGSLAEPRAGCLVAAERDVYYSAWASFVDFLVGRYGWEAFGEALKRPPVGEDLADYEGAFGRPLADLVADWERTVLGADYGATASGAAGARSADTSSSTIR
jgi:hypothetical protein